MATPKTTNEDQKYIDKVVRVNRVAKVVKGGRRFSFGALVVVGDQNGTIGVGVGKANEAPEAIRKATERAKAELFTLPVINGTIPHISQGEHGAGKVLLRPAGKGTGVIAGGAVRAVMEVAGVHDVLTKCIGSNNAYNVIYATCDALKRLSAPEDVAKRRGKTVEELGITVSHH